MRSDTLKTAPRKETYAVSWGVTDQTYFRWKKQYAGLGMPEIRRSKQLEEENSTLKRLVADLSLDKHMLQEVIAKKL